MTVVKVTTNTTQDQIVCYINDGETKQAIINSVGCYARTSGLFSRVVIQTVSRGAGVSDSHSVNLDS